jgi:hypothetical protein
MNLPALTDPSMTLPLGFSPNLPLTAPAVPAVPAWLTGERSLAVAIGLVGLCVVLVLGLHG